MQIKRRSPLTGKVSTMEIDVTAAQIAAWEAGELAQNAFPYASPSEREFIVTGFTDLEEVRIVDDWYSRHGYGY